MAVCSSSAWYRAAVLCNGRLAVFDDLLVQGDEGIGKGAAAAALVQQLMEPGIQIFDLVGVFPRLPLTFNIELLKAQRFLHLPEGVIGDCNRRTLCGDALKPLANLVDVQHILPGDAPTTTMPRLVSSKMCSCSKRRTASRDGRPADAQLSGQPQLAEHLSLRVFPGENTRSNCSNT